MQEMYKGIAFSPTTVLTQSITATSTTIYVSNPDVFPEAPNYATISTDDTAEVILYTGKTSTSLTGCTRGVEGTAKAWTAGEVIARNYTNKDHEAFVNNINELNNLSIHNLQDGEGSKSLVTDASCVAKDSNCIALGIYTHANGAYSTAIGPFTHAENTYALAVGKEAYAKGWMGHSIGWNTHATGDFSNAIGFFVNADIDYSTVFGKYNKELSNGDLFVIGKGDTDSTRANAFRVSSNAIYGTGAYNTSGADYAEYYEWLDKNPNNDDRVGLFVTFAEGSKIRIANENDNYILGVVSGNPSVIGNSYNDQWQGMYLKDHFDRIIYEDIEVPAKYETIHHQAEYTTVIDNKTGEAPKKEIKKAYDEKILIKEAHTEKRPKINPEYDPTKPFIGRAKRPEWATVGTHGQLSVYDDGSCQVDGYCKAGNNGVATSSKKEANTYRVIERLTDNIIKIQIK